MLTCISTYLSGTMAFYCMRITAIATLETMLIGIGLDIALAQVCTGITCISLGPTLYEDVCSHCPCCLPAALSLPWFGSSLSSFAPLCHGTHVSSLHCPSLPRLPSLTLPRQLSPIVRLDLSQSKTIFHPHFHYLPHSLRAHHPLFTLGLPIVSPLDHLSHDSARLNMTGGKPFG